MNSLEPLILCHPACSGGSLIFKVVCAQLALMGVSEKSHRFHLSKNAFLPTDPEFSLYNSGVITLDEFGEIFIDRVKNAIEIAHNAGYRPLIREHTHSYFFLKPQLPGLSESPSWIALRLREKFGINSKCIVTFRDPIDSWLGLERNFPDSAPSDFDQYCQFFRGFLNSVRANVNQGDSILVRYEDFVKEPIIELQRIAEFAGCECSNELISNWQAVASSGNSGRQSSSIRLRKRRSMDARLIGKAEKSEAYQEVIQKLDYPSLKESVTWARILISPFVQIERYVATVLLVFREKLGKWVRGRSYSR